jgi:hypothetical protein
MKKYTEMQMKLRSYTRRLSERELNERKLRFCSVGCESFERMSLNSLSTAYSQNGERDSEFRQILTKRIKKEKKSPYSQALSTFSRMSTLLTGCDLFSPIPSESERLESEKSAEKEDVGRERVLRREKKVVHNRRKAGMNKTLN